MTITPEYIVAALGIALALWYLVASIFNRRRGIAVYRWLQRGLDRFGGEVAGRWIGSSGSGAQIQVRKATPPFKELDIIYLLASRELLPLFLVDLLRGKRDRLIVKATLRSAHAGELEVVQAASGLARQMRAEKAQPWRVEEVPGSLLVGVRGKSAEELHTALTPLIEKYGDHIQRISWSKKAPHLIVILSLADLYEKGGSAAGLYDDLAAVASATSGSA